MKARAYRASPIGVTGRGLSRLSTKDERVFSGSAKTQASGQFGGKQMSLIGVGIRQAELGRIPDALIRPIIRRMLRQRLDAIAVNGGVADHERHFAETMATQPIAMVPDKANEQHAVTPSLILR